jgi:ribosomal protein S12 methylthiotransferase accessory factor YcaO
MPGVDFPVAPLSKIAIHFPAIACELSGAGTLIEELREEATNSRTGFEARLLELTRKGGAPCLYYATRRL